MPNQSDPNQPQNPVAPVITPPVDTPHIPDFQAMDTPSVPAENIPVTPTAPPSKEDGTSSPPESLSVVSPGNKKKFGGGKIVATILGVFLLVGSMGAGIYLTQQRQIFQEKAYVGYSNQTPCDIVQISATETPRCEDNCDPNDGCWGKNDIGNKYSTTYYLKNLTNEKHTVDYGQYAYYCPRLKYGDNNHNCMLNSVESQHSITLEANQTISIPISIEGLLLNGQSCGTYQTDVIVWSIDGNANCSGGKRVQGQGFGVCRTGINCGRDWTPPTPTPSPIASCQDIKAYSTAWILLTPTQLSALKVGDAVNFCVAGTTTQGVFEKGKFTINGVAQAETTTKRPGSDDFCQLYTIPTATNSFNITAQIYHSTLGWK